MSRRCRSVARVLTAAGSRRAHSPARSDAQPLMVESRCGAVAVGRTYLFAAPFVWRCLNSSTVAPFPHPARRTGHAELPHPALGQDFTPLLSRATPSAVSEPSSELIGCPISRFLTASCVCLELRSLPSTGIARRQRYYDPLRRPRASGWSSPTTPWGFPCCLRFPCIHAVATSPAQRRGHSSLVHPPRVSLPRKGCRVGLRIVLFEACSAFTRVTACTLALSPIRDTLSEGFSHFVTSMTAPIASGWSGCRVGLAPTGKAPPFHGARQEPTFADSNPADDDAGGA
jgi:hypothetical protein